MSDFINKKELKAQREAKRRERELAAKEDRLKSKSKSCKICGCEIWIDNYIAPNGSPHNCSAHLLFKVNELEKRCKQYSEEAKIDADLRNLGWELLSKFTEGPQYYPHEFKQKERVEYEWWLTIDEGCHLSYITFTCALCGTEHISLEKDPTTHWLYKIPASITTSNDPKKGHYFHCVECKDSVD